MKKDNKKVGNEYYNYFSTHKVLIIILIVVIAFILIMKLYEKNKTNVPKEDVVITIKQGDNVSVGLGNTIKLDASINIDNAVISWASSDQSVVRVENGNVTGINYGSAIITAIYVDGNNKYSKDVKVKVIDGNPSVMLDTVSFPEGDLYMPLNHEYQLNLILTPSNAMIKDKSFTSYDSNIASVSSSGLVTAKREGHTKIVATINGNYKAVKDVYVSSKYTKSEIVISPTTISFSSATKKIKLGNSEILDYTIKPNNVDQTKLMWQSSNPDIVLVDQNGKISAKKEGMAVVSLTSDNGKSDSIVIEVYKEIIEVKDIIISTSSLNMEAGKTEIITPVVSPSNASNYELYFYSEDASIASVTPNKSNTSATISALKSGKTNIVVRSGNIEKKIAINVTGNGNNSSAEEDDPKLPTTIKVRSDKNNLAKSYEEAVKIPVSGVTNVSVTMSIGVGKIKYCINKYGSTSCTPNIELYADDTITIPSGDIYVLRIIKYDYSGNKISSTSTNYINGVLNYYINTKNINESGKYTVTGAYDTSTKAMAFPNKIGDKVVVSLQDKTRYLKLCTSVESTCAPSIIVRNSYTVNINKTGLWRIFINEYDQNNNKIGSTEIYYVYVKGDTTTPTPVYDNSQFKSSNLKILNDTINGKYLSVYVEGEDKFYNTRFCYTVVNKNAYGTCILDLTSNSVAYYNNGNIVRPKEEKKTYYATLSSAYKYNFKFYLSALDNLYKDGNTNKDIIFEFAVRTSKGFSNPIRVRINMIKKTGNDSSWSVNFIK